MGETQKRPFQLSFNSSLRVEFRGARVTSDGGLILVRELDERLGVASGIAGLRPVGPRWKALWTKTGPELCL